MRISTWLEWLAGQGLLGPLVLVLIVVLVAVLLRRRSPAEGDGAIPGAIDAGAPPSPERERRTTGSRGKDVASVVLVVGGVLLLLTSPFAVTYDLSPIVTAALAILLLFAGGALRRMD